jgi:hypothetical protein
MSILAAPTSSLTTSLSPLADGVVAAPEAAGRVENAAPAHRTSATDAPRDTIAVLGVDPNVVQIVRNMNALLDSLQRGGTGPKATAGQEPSSLTLSDVITRLRAYNAQLARSETGGVSVQA